METLVRTIGKQKKEQIDKWGILVGTVGEQKETTKRREGDRVEQSVNRRTIKGMGGRLIGTMGERRKEQRGEWETGLNNGLTEERKKD